MLSTPIFDTWIHESHLGRPQAVSGSGCQTLPPGYDKPAGKPDTVPTIVIH